MTIISKVFITILAAVSATTATAQTESHKELESDGLDSRFDESALQRIMPTRFGGRSRKWREEAMADEELANRTKEEKQNTDSLCLPTLNQKGQPMTIGRYPLSFGGWYDWQLHRGLNAQIGASVFAQFGKGAHGGAGFQQNIALMYATPITDKLSIAVGGYLNNVNYAGSNWHDAGVSAVLGYRFNEHWEAYIYGQKSITNNVANRMRYSMYDGYYGGGYGMGAGRLGAFSRNFYGMPAYSIYDMSDMGDRIGATVRYNVNDNFSIQVSMERRWAPDR